MRHTKWINGDWNAICQSCNRQFKYSQLQRRWDNYKVCAKCWEPKPEAFQKYTVIERNVTNWVNADIIIPASCTFITRQAVAGVGTAGCMVAGLDQGYR